MREPGPMNHSETGVHGPGSASYPSPSRMTAEGVQHPPIPARIQISNSRAETPVLFEDSGLRCLSVPGDGQVLIMQRFDLIRCG